jgi:hypothetical protein
MTILGSLGAAALLLFFVPILVYVTRRNALGARWGTARGKDSVHGGGAYRQTIVPTWTAGDAPPVVLVASFTCFLLGQLAVVAPLALIGLLFVPENPVLLVSVLSAPTGAVVAVKLFLAGNRMIVNAPDAARRARNAAVWSLVHNVVLLAAFAASPLPAPHDVWNFAFLRADSAQYAVGSIAQALLVLVAARALDVHNRIFSPHTDGGERVGPARQPRPSMR